MRASHSAISSGARSLRRGTRRIASAARWKRLIPFSTHHLERRGGRALLVEAAHVEAVDVGVPVHDLVNRPLVAVEGEDDRLVRGEELDELRRGHAVRVIPGGEEPHQVDHVDDAHA